MTTEELRKRVEEEVNKIRPRLQMDGGDVVLVDVKDGIVKLEMQGACSGCPMSAVTLHLGIERALKKAIPEIKGVEAVNVNVPPEFLERIRQMQREQEEMES